METIIEVIIKLVVEWIEPSIRVISFVGFLAFLRCWYEIHTKNCALWGQRSTKRKDWAATYVRHALALGGQKLAKRKEGKEQKLTHLRDISDEHEFALHKEAHSFRKVLLYTIVSVLLIMGICGTMLEVHTKLGDHPLRLNEVLSVLGPAKLAVGWSIVLLIFKGIYIHCVEDYMQRHDFAAMEELTVQREKRGRISRDEYEKIASKIQPLHEKINNYTGGWDHALVEMKKVLGKSRKPAPQWVNFSYEMPIITTDTKGMLMAIMWQWSDEMPVSATGSQVGETGSYRTLTAELKSGDFLPDTAQVGVPGGAYPAEKLTTQS